MKINSIKNCDDTKELLLVKSDNMLKLLQNFSMEHKRIIEKENRYEFDQVYKNRFDQYHSLFSPIPLENKLDKNQIEKFNEYILYLEQYIVECEKYIEYLAKKICKINQTNVHEKQERIKLITIINDCLKESIYEKKVKVIFDPKITNIILDKNKSNIIFFLLNSILLVFVYYFGLDVVQIKFLHCNNFIKIFVYELSRKQFSKEKKKYKIIKKQKMSNYKFYSSLSSINSINYQLLKEYIILLGGEYEIYNSRYISGIFKVPID